MPRPAKTETTGATATARVGPPNEKGGVGDVPQTAEGDDRARPTSENLLLGRRSRRDSHRRLRGPPRRAPNHHRLLLRRDEGDFEEDKILKSHLQQDSLLLRILFEKKF